MIDLSHYGYGVHYPSQEPEEGLLPARITVVHRGRYQAVCPLGEVSAVLRGTFLQEAQAREDLPTVGDYVFLRHNETGAALITEMLPRKSKFSRPDFLGHLPTYTKNILEQVVAANFDSVLLLASLNNDFSAGRLQRYLAAAWQSGGQPVVVLTKADLCHWPEAMEAEAKAVAGAAPVLVVSSHTGQGLEQLAPYLAPGKTLVFLGSSGVGKSSLVNALAGEDLMEVRAVREDDDRGRHTTTHRQLFRLPCGALVIDTPGMRELGLWDADLGVGEAFADVEELFLRCRFHDCTHKSEPGCAVLAALEDGSLLERRWRDYENLKRENAFVRRKSWQLQHKQEKNNLESSRRKSAKRGRGRVHMEDWE